MHTSSYVVGSYVKRKITAEFSMTRPCANINCARCSCNDRRTYSFELCGEKIDPNLDDQCHEEHELFVVDDPDLIILTTQEHEENKEDDDDYGKNMEFLEEPNNEFALDSGYLSDPPQKKGVPWTEDEHRSFLAGLEKLGRGNWREISKFYVPTRSATQVASHAQKYFLRMKTKDKRKRRSSLFDIPPNESMEYNNNIDDYRASNPECSQMVPFGSITGHPDHGKVHPHRGCWTQCNTDRAPFPLQHWPVIHGPPQAGSLSEGDLLRNKID